MSAQKVKVFGDGWGNMTDLPTRHETNMMFVCEKCGDVKSKTLKGAFDVDPDTTDQPA